MLKELPPTSLTYGQSLNIWIGISGELCLGHIIFTFGREKAKYCLVETQLRIAFQIYFHNCLFVETLACWYKYFEVNLTKQRPLL